MAVTQCAEDGRTTVMIKNIPNKYTKQLMLQRLDALFKDSYDFFYLPIDYRVGADDSRTSATWGTRS